MNPVKFLAGAAGRASRRGEILAKAGKPSSRKFQAIITTN
jgi:hypothetical protein